MAPEIIDTEKRPFKITEEEMTHADIWSFGIYRYVYQYSISLSNSYNLNHKMPHWECAHINNIIDGLRLCCSLLPLKLS